MRWERNDDFIYLHGANRQPQVIQRAEHRDTQALHAKLDELLRADKIARTELVKIDDEEPEVIEERRAADRKRDE